MKHIIVSIFAFFFAFSINANNESDNTNNETNSGLYLSLLDPGHKQKRGTFLGKDRAPFEIFYGSQPSWAIKINFYGRKYGTQVERFYFMGGMDFDQDVNAKFGVSLNPGKRNKVNQGTYNNPFDRFVQTIMPKFRYVMLRKSLEIGFKTYFMDTEDSLVEQLNNRNYSGLTFNLSYAWDGIPFLTEFMWRTFDMRTARRLRLKLDAGIFLNLNKFDKAHIGSWTFNDPESSTGEIDINEDIVDALGNFVNMPVYPLVSPFFNISVGFAINPHR